MKTRTNERFLKDRTWQREQKATSKNKRKVRQADGSMKESTIGKQEEMKEMESVFSSNVELGEIRSQHPATFPIELPKRCIKLFSFIGDVILDPFLGSGTTVIAANSLFRKGIGIEVDQKYCDLTKKRLLSESKLITKEIFDYSDYSDLF